MVMDGFIGALVGWFINKLRKYAGGIAGRILSTLGIGLTTHNFVLPNLVAFVQGYVGAVPVEVLALLGYINVDKAITMIISAYVAKKALKVLFSPLSSMNGGGSQPA